MSRRDPFLAAIRANPADDTARLAYADRLDEGGDADRAEFIRVQVALARTPVEDRARDELAERERQLLRAHADRWRAELPKIPHVHWGGFSRGFVHECRLAEPVEEDTSDHPGVTFPDGGRLDALVPPGSLAAAFAAPVDRLELAFHHETSLRRVAGAPDRSRAKELGLAGQFDVDELLAWLASPRSAHLEALHLKPGGGVFTDDLARLVGSPRLELLRTLDLTSAGVGPGFAALAAAPPLANLEVLKLGWSGHSEGVRVGNEGLQALAASPHLRLRELELNNCRVTAAGVRALAGSAAFAGLARLDLRGNRIGAGGAAALAESRHLGRLAELDLPLCELTAAGLRALAASPGLATVRSLDVGGNRAGDAAAEAIARARWRLTNLRMIGVRISAAGAAELAASPALAGLVSLDLQGNPRLGPGGLAAVGGAPWPGLRALNLSGCSLTADAVAGLASSPGPGRLHTLDVSHNGFGDAGAAALAGWPGLAGVRELRLSYCLIGAEGAKALADSPHLRPGVRLVLFGNPDIPKRAVTRLRKEYGDGVWWEPEPDDDY